MLAGNRGSDWMAGSDSRYKRNGQSGEGQKGKKAIIKEVQERPAVFFASLKQGWKDNGIPAIVILWSRCHGGH